MTEKTIEHYWDGEGKDIEKVVFSFFQCVEAKDNEKIDLYLSLYLSIYFCLYVCVCVYESVVFPDVCDRLEKSLSSFFCIQGCGSKIIIYLWYVHIGRKKERKKERKKKEDRWMILEISILRYCFLFSRPDRLSRGLEVWVDGHLGNFTTTTLYYNLRSVFQIKTNFNYWTSVTFDLLT